MAPTVNADLMASAAIDDETTLKFLPAHADGLPRLAIGSTCTLYLHEESHYRLALVLASSLPAEARVELIDWLAKSLESDAAAIDRLTADVMDEYPQDDTLLGTCKLSAETGAAEDDDPLPEACEPGGPLGDPLLDSIRVGDPFTKAEELAWRRRRTVVLGADANRISQGGE